MLKKFGYLNGVMVIVASAVVVLSTMIPYHMIDERTPDGSVFYGISTNLPDAASYMMWFNQHAKGAILVQNHMTVEPHPSLLPNPAWMLIGLYKATFGSNTLFSYNFMRMMLALLYLPLLYMMLARLLPSRRWTWMAWSIIAVGGGLGWLNLIGIKVPSADWMTELWSWPSMLHYPHFVLSLILVVAFHLVGERANKKFSRPLSIFAGLLLALLFLVHPYTAGTMLLAIVIFSIFMAWRRKVTPELFPDVVPASPWIVLVSIPAIAALAVQTILNPVAAAWASQNHMPSPPLWEYIFGFGVPGVLAVLMTVKMIRGRAVPAPELTFGALWVVTGLVLAYADPLVPFARRCVEALHIPVVFMAVRYITTIESKRVRTALVILTLITTLPAPLYHIDREVTPDNPGYMAADTPEMLDAVRYWVKDGNIVSDPRTSLFIAAETDARVFVAHHEVTPGFKNKIARAYRFMTQPTTLKERIELMQEINCPWVVSSPAVAYGMLKGEPDPEDLKKIKEYARGTTWVLIGPASP